MSSLHREKQCTHTCSWAVGVFLLCVLAGLFHPREDLLGDDWGGSTGASGAGRFLFCVELLLGLGELAAKGAACCCSLTLSVWLLPWLALGRIQLPLMSPFLCAGGRTDVVWMGQIGF